MRGKDYRIEKIQFICSIYMVIKQKKAGFCVILGCIIFNLIHQFDYYGIMYWLPFFMLGGYEAIHFKSYAVANGHAKEHVLKDILLVALGIVGIGSFVSGTAWIMYIFRLIYANIVACCIGKSIMIRMKASDYPMESNRIDYLPILGTIEF